jgi:hypothetical protein
MNTNKPFCSSLCRSTARLGIALSLGFLVGCAQEEAPKPQVEAPKPSLVDQYKDTSKATAENPGLAGSPKDMEEEEKKPAGQ